jgi:hypothetical protein
MARSTVVSPHFTKKTAEGVYVPKFDHQNGLKVLGNTIGKDLGPSEIR